MKKKLSKGVKFMGCNFECASGFTYTTANRGIYSTNASYIVDKYGAYASVFKKLKRGIDVNNTNPLIVPLITNTNFIENINYGARFAYVNNLVFQNNNIELPGIKATGAYLYRCANYTVKSNTFTENSNNQASDGIGVFRSFDGPHQIFRNNFSKLMVGINSMDNNNSAYGTGYSPTSGLLMNCNVFNTNLNKFDIALTHTTGYASPTVKMVQGVVNNSAYWGNLVRNIYGATCTNTVTQNNWYIHVGSSPIDHGSNTNSVTAITQPTCKSSYVTVVNKSIPLNYVTDCPPFPPSAGGQTQRLSNMNEYLNGLQTDNPDGVNDYEIQATVASRLNLFLTDTLLQNIDSVITILENNQGNMQDADVQTVFAYLYKGDYVTALEKTDALVPTKPVWATLLTKIIELEQIENGIYGICENENDRNFFIGYADTDGIDGQAVAQNILLAACDIEYLTPHFSPDEEEGGRKRNPETTNNHDNPTNIESAKTVIKVYPNPAKTGINVSYTSEIDGVASIELKDLTGRLIYSTFITGKLNDHYIPFNDFSNGMYILTATKNKEVVYKIKIIKED